MSEIKKNIETCRGEDVLAEVSGLPQDPHFGSLVNEALDPLKQQALHQAGYDGYSEVIAQHKPYTFASFIRQMKSNLLLLLRALWQFPFGSGTLRSLSDMWSHYITRLSGNETYGIPSRLSSLTDLPSAPLLVADRKISGVPAAADGISLVHLLNDTSEITELTDDNVGWTMTKGITNTPFANLKKIRLGIKDSTVGIVSNQPNLEELELPNLDGNFRYIIHGTNKVKRLYLPNAKVADNVTAGGGGETPIESTEIEELVFGITTMTGSYHIKVITNCSTIKRLILPNYVRPTYCSLFSGCPNLEYVYVPKTVAISLIGYDGNNISNLAHLHTFISGGFQQGYYSGESEETQYGSFKDCPNLIHLEAAQTINASTNIMAWSPTNALDASLDTLVTDEDCHNNLEQFLSNFRTYIALRLTDNGSGLTLTLSQAVYDAIKGTNGGYASTHTLGEIYGESLVLTPLEIELGITENTLYSTWLTTYFGENGINWNIETPN